MKPRSEVSVEMNEREIFAAALEMPTEAARAAFLDGACGDDPLMRERIDGLLSERKDLGSFLESPPVACGATADLPGMDLAAGMQIGPYKLLQKLGEGGMGVVYMAEQRAPVERRVALKIIKPGMDTRQVIARFEAERQALAMMDHPNIAKVLDAGSTFEMRNAAGGMWIEDEATGSPDSECRAPQSNRPYFVMELVKGVPMTEFCDANTLSLRQRLELILPVCHAIQHAHQKGVIHRDVKPSNIMVTLYDGKPVPKVIDFGVAKAIARQLTEKTMFTQYGHIIGTFEYMSPEQAEMSAIDVDTRSDIYSLGVLTYELLTGTTPITRHRLREAGLSEMLRLIREEEPERPSMRLSRSGDALPTISAQRQTEPDKLGALLSGELDWIVLKALEKDRSRRYESASALARDIQRYLDNEPVEACPPSASYRLRKFLHKRRGPVAAATGVLAALIVGLCASLAMFFQAEEQHRTAEAARASEARKSTLLAAALNSRSLALDERTRALADKEAALQEKDLALKSSESLRLDAQSTAVLPDNPGLALLLAEEAAIRAPTRVATHNNALLAAIVHCRELRCMVPSFPGSDRSLTNVVVTSVAYSRDGTRIVTTGKGTEQRTWKREDVTHRIGVQVGFAQVWTTDGELAVTIEAPPDQVFASVELSPDGRSLAGRFANSSVVSYGDEPDQVERTRCLFTDRVVRVWDVATGEELYVLSGHTQPITSVRFSPDSRRILTASWDGSARVWDATSGKREGTVSTARIAIEDACFNADGTRFCTVVHGWERDTTYADAENEDDRPHRVDPPLSTVFDHNRIVDTQDGQRGSGARNLSLAASLDLPLIGALRFRTGFTPRILWDAKSFQPVVDEAGVSRKAADGMTTAAFMRDGRRLLVATGSSEVVVLDADDGREQLKFPTTGGKIRSFQISRDDRRILLVYDDGGFAVHSADDGSELQQWTGLKPNVRKAVLGTDGRRVCVLRGPPPQPNDSLIPPGDDLSQYLHETTTVDILDVESGALVATLTGHYRPIADIALSPNSDHAITASSDGTARIWTVAAAPSYGKVFHSGGPVQSASFSPDGRTVLVANAAAYAGDEQSDYFAGLWDVTSGKRIAVLRGGDGSETSPLAEQGFGGVTLAQFSPDGRRILTVTKNRHVRIIDPLATGLELFTNPQSEWPISVALPYTPVSVWDAATGEELFGLKGLTCELTWAGFSPDGRRIVTLSSQLENYRHLQNKDGTMSIVSTGGSRAQNDPGPPIHVWDAKTGELQLTMRDIQNPHIEWESPLAWSPDGKSIAMFDLIGAVFDLEAEEGSILPGIASHAVPRFSPDGRYLLAVGRRDAILCDLSTLQEPKGKWGGELELTRFTRDGGKDVKRIPHGFGRTCENATLAGHEADITFAVFRPDSRLIVTTSKDGTARLWDAGTGSLRHVLRGHLRAVRQAAFSPDGRYVATASDDHTARIWDAATGQEFFTLRGHEGPVRTVDFSPDGQSVVTASDDGTGRLWPVDPLPVARARRPRELTPEERNRFQIPAE